MTSPAGDPERFLPLHPLELRILLVLWKEKAHGYRIVKAIEESHGGWNRIFPANLYRRVRDLLAQGLVEEAGADAEDADPRRRYFQITRLGREVARLEARRLSELAADARDLLEGS
jgi:DNA-binding PadR family transcriptional regulator